MDVMMFILNCQYDQLNYPILLNCSRCRRSL